MLLQLSAEESKPIFEEFIAKLKRKATEEGSGSEDEGSGRKKHKKKSSRK